MSAHEQPSTRGHNTECTPMNDMSQGPGTYSTIDYDPFIDAVPIARVVPTTETQREIWLACQLGVDASMAYNESVSLRLQGHPENPLDTKALRCALGKLVARHDALRATFSADGQQMFVAEMLALDMPEYDISALADEQREIALQRHIRADVDTPFNLEKGPLLRTQLVELGAFDAVLVLTAHHIVCDGWSFGVLLRDLGGLYAQAIGQPAALTQPGSFSDFAQALLAREVSPEHASDEAYWLARYSSSPPVLDLPLDHPRPPQRRFASQRIDHTLPTDLIEQVRRLGGSQGSSLLSTLLTAFAALLQRLSGAEEVVVGVPAAGQTLPGYEQTVGHAVNLLPLRLSPDPAAPLASALGSVQSDVLDAFEHQHYTFGTLLKRLIIERDPSRVPLAPVMFNLDQALDLDRYAGLRVNVTSNPRLFENFELFINAVPEHGGLRLECQYATALFSTATVSRWLACFETLLRKACAQQTTPLAQLDITSTADQAQLVENNATAVPLPGELLVHRWLQARPGIDPAAIALANEEELLTHAALWQRAHRIARALRARGVAHGTRVGLCLPRNADMLPTMLGALLSGAAYVPLDPNFPSNRLADMAEDAQLALLVTHSSVADALPWPRSQTLWLDADAATITTQPDAPLTPNAALDAKPESPAYLIYTSGSTGKPKGVMVPHRAVVSFLMAVTQRPGLTANDRLLAVTTLSFDIAVLELMLPLATGASIVLATREQASDGNALRQLLEAERVTVLQATPSTWRLLLGAGWGGTRGFKALVGGEALPPELAQQLLRVCGEVWNMYGPTETTVWSTCWRVQAPETGISIGTPLANTQVWIGNTYGRPCPLGVPGEILIGGAGVALGYWQRPDLTAERFIPDTFSGRPGATLYRTGDLGRWRDDGFLEHLGRLDFQVKLRGFRIELGDIEFHLASHPDVAQAVALVREDTPGDARLVAYFVPKRGQPEPSPAALRDHLRASLPAYMLPQHFVPLPMMPVLPNGKIDRKHLPAAQAAGRAGAAPAARAMPHTSTERRVAEAMQTVLELASLGLDDDFFALGGHSLLAAQLASQLRQYSGLDIDMATVFANPSIDRLARWIDAHAAQPQARAQAVPARADQRTAPASLQQGRIWFLDQLDPSLPTFNSPSAHRLRGPLDVSALERAINAMITRQTSLRTYIIEDDDGKPMQVVLPELQAGLGKVEDLSALPAAEREAELTRRLQARSAEVFNLSTPPLFKLSLYRLANDDHVLFFMPHHIIWDGWSFDLVYDEMAALYPAFAAGRQPDIAPLAVSYGDYADWQRHWLQTPDLQRQLAYWREVLTPLPEPLNVTGDRPRPARMSGAGDTHWIRQNFDWFEVLQGFGKQHEATPYMVLLAGFAALLWQQSGQTDLIIGTPVRGRPAVELESVMGFFVNTLPLRFQVNPEQSFLSLLKQSRAVALGAFAAPDAPLEQMLQFGGVSRNESRSPIYQAFFSYQDARRRNHAWGGVKQENLRVHQRAAAEDVRLWFMVEPDGVLGGLTYNTDVFDAELVTVWVTSYLQLLEAALRQPDAALRTVVTSTATARLPVQAPATPALFHTAVEPRRPGPQPQAEHFTPTEAQLRQVWRELLGVDEIERSDNFFDLGGHSLLVMQAIASMRNLTHKSMQPRAYVLESLAQIAARYEAQAVESSQRPSLIKRLFGGAGRHA